MSFYYGGGSSSNFDPPLRSNRDAGGNVQELTLRLDRMHLMVQTLSRLLVAKGLVTEEELNEWMRYVDSLDGNVDGKLRSSRAPVACSHCKRMNPPTAPKCQYCGGELPSEFLDRNEQQQQG